MHLIPINSADDLTHLPETETLPEEFREAQKDCERIIIR